MWGAIALLLAVPIQPGEEPRPLTPADAIAQAHADLAKLPDDLRHDVRYLSLYATPRAERAKLIQALSGHVNGLSREVDLYAPTIVPNTDGALIRVNLVDYRWDAKVWEKLLDPHFTTFIVKEVKESWPGGIWKSDSKYYAPGSFQTTKKSKVQALAPWLTETVEAKARLAEVVLWTKSQVPVVSAEWFLHETAIQEGRRVGYYDFLAVKNQKDFEKNVRFNAELALQLEHRRAVVFSGIALQPRRIERTKTVLGGLWRTFDNEKAIDKANPLRILDDDFTFQATEQIGPLPNGMPAFYLGNDKGVRQDKAPDQIIGGDKTGASNDTRLHINLSCIRCHLGANKNERGVKEADFAKIVKLKSVDYAKFLELKRQYLRDLDEPIKSDRAAYQAAIRKATGGMDPYEYATEYQRFFAKYDGPVDLTRAAAELGTTKEVFLRALRAYDARADLDPVLSILMGGRAIGVDQWEEVIPVAHLTLRGYSQ